jgi:hypothetical protein
MRRGRDVKNLCPHGLTFTVVPISYNRIRQIENTTEPMKRYERYIKVTPYGAYLQGNLIGKWASRAHNL